MEPDNRAPVNTTLDLGEEVTDVIHRVTAVEIDSVMLSTCDGDDHTPIVPGRYRAPAHILDDALTVRSS